MLNGLIDKTAQKENALQIPVALRMSALPWLNQLADLLRDLIDRDYLRSFLLVLQGPGLPYERCEALAAAKTWLIRIGFSPDDDPALFPVDIADLIQRIRESGRLGEDGMRELTRSSSLSEDVAEILAACWPFPIVAQECLSAAELTEQPEAVLDELCVRLIDRAAAGPDGVPLSVDDLQDWLGALTTHHTDRDGWCRGCDRTIR